MNEHEHDDAYENLAALMKRVCGERTELVTTINRAHRALLGEDMGETALQILQRADHRIRCGTIGIDL